MQSSIHVSYHQKTGDLKSIGKSLGNRDVNAPDEKGRIPTVFAVDTGKLIGWIHSFTEENPKNSIFEYE